MQVSAAGFAQRLTMQKTQASLKEVFTEIKRQTGYNVVWDSELLKNSKPVEAKFDNEEVCKVLDQILVKQNLDYTIADKTIVIKENKKTSFLENFFDRFNNIDVSGKILDENGKPLPGASVKVKKTGKGVSTDKDGRFFLRGVEEGALLVVSFIGYLPKEVSASANMGSVVLEQSLSKLDEIQVIAYGTTTRRWSTGNVSSIKAKEISQQPVNNPLLALSGRIPGVAITQYSGLPGGGVGIQVQGTNSLSGGNDPFFVIDGVPYPAQNASNRGTILGLGNPLNYINPGDIESIDVLKDADATAIYGSRAANGAILITTKKGQAGSTKVDLNLQSGIGKVARKIDLLDTKQYLEMRKEAIKNAGLSIPANPAPAYYDLTLYDPNRYTDWQDELIGSTARYTDVQSSISGGSSNTQFLFGANYHKETDVFPGEFADKKGAVHFNLLNSSRDRKFQFSFSGNYLIDNNKLPGTDLTMTALQISPNAPALYDQYGNLNWERYNGVATWRNPIASTLVKYNNKTSNLISNAEVSYELITNLKLKSSFGYNKLQTDETTITPQASYSPNITSNNRSAGYNTSATSSWIIEPQLTYQLNNSIGKFDLLIGSTFQRTNNNSKSLISNGYADDARLESIMAATSVTATSDIQSVYNYSGVFARINYNYSDRYIINLTTRRDGSSRFGSENLFHNFYAAAGAWVFSNESWFKKAQSIISYGKLKISYGTSGSDQIGDYRFMSLYDNYNSDIAYGGGTGIKPSGLSNPYLQWEETRKINAGVDLGFFNDKIILNVNYYRNRSSNQLVSQALPITTGFNGLSQNFDAIVQNKGIEFSVNSTNLKTRDFQWTTSLNISSNSNQLIKYDGLEASSMSNSLVIGEPINIIKAFKFAGVNDQTGLYQFVKLDGTKNSSPLDPDDKYVLINTTPKYFGGLSNTIDYKGFTLDFLFQFVKQIGTYSGKFGYIMPGLYSTSTAFYNQPITILNRWKQPNDISSVQKVTTNFGEASDAFRSVGQSDASFVDASYMRLKNLSLSWTLPKTWIKPALLQRARLYFQGQNLLTFTKFKGLDPESQSLSLPPLRVLTFGIQLTL